MVVLRGAVFRGRDFSAPSRRGVLLIAKDDSVLVLMMIQWCINAKKYAIR